ncbi:hypothetical protein N7493_012082 [Penicillium malachiteum]|uniref:Uncharacterized protein n=1 Tax=Penicillium malachiteum TaxID=1324776 RepID=A0AAD6H9V4_9EURO|nr:hypothetical protein N7493_012082 [Penicillium malachiteum]
MDKTDIWPSVLNHESLVCHPLAARFVAEFMLKTGLLGQFHNYEIDLENIDTDSGMVNEDAACYSEDDTQPTKKEWEWPWVNENEMKRRGCEGEI